ncbi:hypothetical protein BD626DRAFT_407170 [Schizophyllum amplum]|uniref:Amine oxidase domain-containing protein n=1 Tax=Schizophyllum amplum TaxID=97359 RepID=A0A550C715_9AGAR|nr:hypothetical protein BD626DRAFT_407170 [Auriculariopsis ampla]
MKVAIVGSGVSGLGATWLLNEYSGHQVHLYESDDRPGGHANTVRFYKQGQQPSEGVDVDTGFIVFNPTTYPNFLQFLRLFQSINILPTEMTFSVSRDNGAFEWAGNNLMTVFCQPKRLLDPDMWRLLYDVLRFNACARRILSDEAVSESTSIGDYLKRERYSGSFTNNYLIPMTAAIWSTPPDKCATDFPARTLIRFMRNHHLLQVTGKPKWLTIQGGSINYVKQILSKLPADQLHLSTPVQSIRSLPESRVELRTAAGAVEIYDRVIMACHSDTARSILEAGGAAEEGGITARERDILGIFKWNKNECILHHDERLMPRSKPAWSCWNYLTSSVVDADGNVLPNEPRISLRHERPPAHPPAKYGPVLVTLNSPFEPAAEKVVGRWKYEHPVLDAQAVRAQKLLKLIQGTRSIWYAGAYTKYGFHEDGFASGLAAAVGVARSAPADGDSASATGDSASSNAHSTPAKGSPLEPPFPIVTDIDEHLLYVPGEWPWLVAVVALFFRVAEWVGVPAVIARVACPCLALVRWVLGVDLGGKVPVKQKAE